MASLLYEVIYMFCEKCGRQVMQGEKFCRSCGNPVSNSDISSQQGRPIQPNVPPVTQKKPKKQKKPINKKVLISVIIGIIAVIAAVVVGAFALNSYVKAAPSREMKKALESKDISQVLDVIKKYDDEEEYSNKVSQLRKTIVIYIKDATSLFNNEFVYDKEFTDEGAVQGAIIEFMESRFGSLFYVNGAKSEIWDLNPYFKSYDLRTVFGEEANGTILIEANEDIYGALRQLDNIIVSKMAYYYGLQFLNNSNDSEDYCNAIEKFNEVIVEDTKYSDAIAKSGEAFDAYFSEILNSADEYIADGDYASAMELLDDALEGLSESEGYSEAIIAKTDEIRKTYASQYAQKAEEYFKAGDIDAAIGSIEAAISIDPDGGYDAKLSEYKMYLPFALYDENNVISKGYRISFEKSTLSTNNKEYLNCISYRYTKDCDPSMVSYYLEGKYDTVSGVCLSPKVNAEMHRKGTAYFEVYGDGKLLYTSPKIRAESLPVDVSFSVKDVQKLEIKFIGSGSEVWGVDSQWYGDYIEICNLTARKSVPQ